MLTITILLVLCALARAQEVEIEEEEMDTVDSALADEEAPAAAAAAPPEIDWSVEPEGPPVTFEVLEKPDACEKAAAEGDFIELHYTGSVQETGTQFDSSYEHEKPLQLLLGEKKRTIRGLDVGLEGICPGERRLIRIPPAWGYGEETLGPIPGGSTLLFEVEALRVATPPKLANDANVSEDGHSMSEWLLLVAVVALPIVGVWYGRAMKPKKAKKVRALPRGVKNQLLKLSLIHI
eukprot:TRINITY_DN8345_c0_g1_i1.p2 TRINITY_DN8345_c0_g1~~TRINITY_DN8345_c0_g1_i1.p2  ORF type:complete len:236 (-),score=95.37 TRINITY_DN8345_c0_g1_i1:34-741(-)